VERSEFNDEGALCVSTGMAGELFISVIVDGCASGCARVVDSACEVDVDNAEFTVHSSISVDQRRGAGVVCPDECVRIGVSCTAMQAPPRRIPVPPR
jgi:hypothetical protein